MKITTITILVFFALTTLVQPGNCRRTGGSRGSRSMSHAARTAATMGSSRRRRQSCGPYLLGVARLEGSYESNGTCVPVEMRILSDSPHKNWFRSANYCISDTEVNCKICNGIIYNSRLFKDTNFCCPGVMGKDGGCYTRHHKDADGEVCDTDFYELDGDGRCYLARPIFYAMAYFVWTSMIIVVLILFVFFAFITYASFAAVIDVALRR